MKSKGLDTTVDAMLRRVKMNLNGGQSPPKMRLPQLGGKLSFGGEVSQRPPITFRPKTPKAPKVPEVKGLKYPFLRSK